MDKSNEKLPRGVWKDKDHYYLERCPKCDRENYALAVAQGICCWCGFNANEEWSENFMAPPLRPQCPKELVQHTGQLNKPLIGGVLTSEDLW